MLSSPTTHACPICTRLSIFRAALHSRFAHRGAIDRRQTLNLDIVFDDGDPGLHDLFVRSVGALGKAEPVAADHDTVLQHYAVPDAAKLPNGSVRMRIKIIADLRAFVDHDMRMQHRIPTQTNVLADKRKRPDRGVFTDLGRFVHKCEIDEFRVPETAADKTSPAPARNRGTDWSR